VISGRRFPVNAGDIERLVFAVVLILAVAGIIRFWR